MSHHHGYNYLDACRGARKLHSAKEWLARKPRIAYLYCEQDLTLQQVMELMRQEANFNATVKMYKSHITLWGLRKNNQLREAQAILRKKHALESAGFHPLFLVRGQLADMNDIERCCKRAKVEFSTIDADAEDRSLPEGVEYLAFHYHLDLIDAPAKFIELQRFLHNTLVYFDSCFDRGLWRSESDDQDLAYPQDMELLAKQCLDDLSYATACFGNGHGQLGQVFAQRAFDNFPAVLQTNHQDVISALLVQLDRIQRKGLDGFLLDAVSRFAKLASTSLPLAHPHAAFFNALETLAYDSIGSLYQVHIAQRRSLYIRNVGRDHYRVVRTEILPSLNEDVNLTPLTHIQEAVALADTRYGPTSRRSLLILLAYCCRIYRTDRSKESEILFSELVQRAEQAGNCQTRVSARYRLGKLQRDQGKNQEARRTWLAALEIAEKDPEVFQIWGAELFDALAKLCHVLGRTQEAKTHQTSLLEFYSSTVHGGKQGHMPVMTTTPYFGLVPAEATPGSLFSPWKEVVIDHDSDATGTSQIDLKFHEEEASERIESIGYSEPWDRISRSGLCRACFYFMIGCCGQGASLSSWK